MGNRHVTDGSLDFGQGKDVFHQLCHFGACEIFDLRGKALNRAAQVAKAVGALGAFTFLQIFLSVLKTVELVLLLCKLRLGSFLFGSKMFKGVSVLPFFVTSFFDFGDKKRPSTFRIVRPVNGLIFGIRFLCSIRQTGSCLCEGYAHFALLLFRTPSFILFTLRFHTKY